jgi:hypothetical protein
MSRDLLQISTDFRVDNRIVPWDELLNSDNLLNELAHALRRKRGWPLRTPEEIRQELRRLHARWSSFVRKWKSESDPIRWAENHPDLWIDESEDEDDLFMASSTEKREATRKSEIGRKGKEASSSKGPPASSSRR